MTEEQKERRKLQQKEYYKENREKIIKRTTEYGKVHRTESTAAQKRFREKAYKEFIDFKKTLSCEECGESDHRCLEFHHKDPKEKVNTISSVFISKGLFQKELQKCIVLCANCHCKKHIR